MEFNIISKDSGKEYKIDTQKLTCTCKDFVYRRKEEKGLLCKHIIGVLNELIIKPIPSQKLNSEYFEKLFERPHLIKIENEEFEMMFNEIPFRGNGFEI